MEKPRLSFWQIWNLSFGFMGVQIGYSLQNGNTSRILQSLGADVHNINLFWLAAPLAGLFVQPIIGLSSDKTWTKMGRRLPFIFFGAIASALAMFFMPNAEYFAYLFPPLMFGAAMLLFMDTAFNVTMQPFRALVGDMLNDDQKNLGFSLQSVLINIGAIFGSLLPFILTAIGVANVPSEGEKVADSVIWSFYIGGSVLLAAVLWTVFRTKEYPPKEFNEYNGIKEEKTEEKSDKNMWQLIVDAPSVFWQLGSVQFFSWFALFLMWVYTTPAIAAHIWGPDSVDPSSEGYNEAGNWTGVIFGFYSVVAAVYAYLIPTIVKAIGRKKTYTLSLFLGGIGFITMLIFQDKNLLFVSMFGIGAAWAAILAMPYAMLAESLPAKSMGVYMGLFNASITLPQIAAGLFGGIILTAFGGSPIMMLVLAGISMIAAGILVFTVKEKKSV